MKTCAKCKSVQQEDNFYTSKGSKDGLASYCKTCYLSYAKLNNERICLRAKSWYLENKSRKSEYDKNYRQENAERLKISDRNKQRKRRACNVQVRIADSLRARIRSLLNTEIEHPSVTKSLDCTLLELKQHLESQFQLGTSWDNWSRTGWHIDHIIPLSSFDLTDREQFLKACHYTNLQPLWAKDNLKKSNKILGG